MIIIRRLHANIIYVSVIFQFISPLVAIVALLLLLHYSFLDDNNNAVLAAIVTGGDVNWKNNRNVSDIDI